MADSAQDRHLPASQRKIDKAREEGRVARSQVLGHFAALVLGGAVLSLALEPLARHLRRVLEAGLRFDAATVANPAAMGQRLLDLGGQMLLLVVPMGVLAAVLAVAAAVAGGGWNFSLQSLRPNFGRFNPITGVARLFSSEQLMQTLKSCAVALVLGTIGAFYLKAHMADFTALLGLSLPAALAQGGAQVTSGLSLLAIALGAVALVDVPLQRFVFLKGLRMSHQEVKEEHKQAEGSPEVKGRIRQRMREASRRRMLAAVPKADLVVMNPTHYAVALRYDETRMAAPRVVAKGADLLALRIRDLARDHAVPVLQAPPLARALYAHAEVEQEIPAALFAAVAQVLAHVWQLRAALAGRGAMPGALPALPVPAELDPHAAQPT